MKTRLAVYGIAYCLLIMLCLAGYGVYGLYTYSDRLDTIESLQADNANMKLKIGRLENNDYSLIIEQLNPLFQDELGLLNEKIRQERIKK